MRTLGVPSNAIQCLSKTIQCMRNYIRTAYGDSDNYYCGTEDDLLQGGGQGNPSAPPMWTAISIIILRILSSYEAGVVILSSISLASMVLSAILYVDDTGMFIYGHSGESVDSILIRTQDLALK